MLSLPVCAAYHWRLNPGSHCKHTNTHARTHKRNQWHPFVALCRSYLVSLHSIFPVSISGSFRCCLRSQKELCIECVELYKCYIRRCFIMFFFVVAILLWLRKYTHKTFIAFHFCKAPLHIIWAVWWHVECVCLLLIRFSFHPNPYCGDNAIIKRQKCAPELFCVRFFITPPPPSRRSQTKCDWSTKTNISCHPANATMMIPTHVRHASH